MKIPEYLGEGPVVTGVPTDVWAEPGFGAPTESIQRFLRGEVPTAGPLVDVRCAICGDVFARVPVGTFPASDEQAEIIHMCRKHDAREKVLFMLKESNR